MESTTLIFFHFRIQDKNNGFKLIGGKFTLNYHGEGKLLQSKGNDPEEISTQRTINGSKNIENNLLIAFS